MLLGDCLTTLVRRDIVRPRSAAAIRSSGSSSSLKINTFRCGVFQPAVPQQQHDTHVPPASPNNNKSTANPIGPAVSPVKAKPLVQSPVQLSPQNRNSNHQHHQHEPQRDSKFSFRIVSYPTLHPPTSTEPRFLHTSPPLTLSHVLSPAAATAADSPSGSSRLGRRGKHDHGGGRGEFDHMAVHNKDQMPLPHIKQLLFELQLRVSSHSRNDKMNELRNAYDALHANDIMTAEEEGEGPKEGEKSKLVRRTTGLQPPKRINWHSIYTNTGD